MKVGDWAPLSCGHQGRVVWVSEDGTRIAVRGTRRRCSVCYKDRTNPNVYLMVT